MIRQNFSGYHCKSGLPSLHEGSLKITLTVPLSGIIGAEEGGDWLLSEYYS